MGTEGIAGTPFENAGTEHGDTIADSLSNEGEPEGDVLDTPSLTLPPQQADIHEGTVISLSTRDSKESGNTYGVITLQSKQTGKTEEFLFFPPQVWLGTWEGGKFDPATLSDVPPPGKKQSARVAFARTVSSTNAEKDEQGNRITKIVGKEGTLQLIRKLADEQGIPILTGFAKPTSGIEYIEAVNARVAGVLEVLFTRRPEKNDNPQFDGNLKVKDILSKSKLADPKFEAAFKNYHFAWN